MYLAIWPEETWAEKWGTPFHGGAGYPSKTMLSGIPLGTGVGHGLGDIVLDEDSAPPTERDTADPPLFGNVYCGQTVAISATAELFCVYDLSCLRGTSVFN